MKKILTVAVLLSLSATSQAETKQLFDNSYNYIDIGYNKILEDTDEETGNFKTFELIDNAQGYNIGIGQKINENFYFDINYASYEDKGKNPLDYVGPTINESKKLHSFTKLDFKIGYIFDLTSKNKNIHINPYLTFGSHEGKSSQITYVDSERKNDVWSYGVDFKHAPYGNKFFYYTIGFQQQDTISEEEVSSTIDEIYYGRSERYKVGINFMPFKKVSTYLNYEFVYSDEQYNEVLTGGYYMNADSLNLGIKIHY